MLVYSYELSSSGSDPAEPRCPTPQGCPARPSVQRGLGAPCAGGVSKAAIARTRRSGGAHGFLERAYVRH